MANSMNKIKGLRSKDHLEQLLLKGGQQLASDAMEGCGSGDELNLISQMYF